MTPCKALSMLLIGSNAFTELMKWLMRLLQPYPVGSTNARGLFPA